MKSVLAMMCGVVLALPMMPSVCQAHFPWLQVEQRASDQPVLQCYFSEAAVSDNPKLLTYLDGAKYWRVASRQDPARLDLTLADGELKAKLKAANANSVYCMTHTLGVRDKGDTPFLLNYYAKTGPSLPSWSWQNKKTAELLMLDVIPSLEDGQLVVTVTFEKKPVAGAEVTLYSDLADLDGTHTTNDQGQVTIDVSEQPVDGLRVKHVVPESGTLDGKDYSEIRHYTTVTFPAVTYQPLPTTTPFATVPETVTSFGAAILDGTLYTYGGHKGSAHSYSNISQANTLWSLDLASGKTWKPLAEGPALQGLALVATDGKLYRIGGFTAKNEEGEEHDLWSQTSFASFDLASQKWTELPDLPERRSSFDAAVLDGIIYVVGGWALEGEGENAWHETAWSFDTTNSNAKWESLPSAPFQRRAVSVAAFDGKIYVVGGMQSTGTPTTKVSIYDPEARTWAEGPRLIGNDMTGFGTSTFAVNGSLYTSTYEGTLQKLSADGKRWDVLGNLENARFFHRMLPLTNKSLLFVGGSNMQIGKFDELEVLDVE